MAIKYIPFNPTILRGQAVLTNFTRTRKILSYRGDDEVEARINRGMPLYDIKEKETHGENKDGNLIIQGECVSACAYLKEKGITVDLVYIDPPFASGADYAKKIYLRRNPKLAEAIAKAKTELDNEDMRTFEAKMYGDIWEKEKYLNWMYENLMAIKSVMSPTASIYVHLDYHIIHYVKIIMDEIFGESNFRNELIWHYPGRERPSNNKFQSKHDTILFYANSEETTINPIKKEWDRESRIKALRRKIYKDKDGKEWFWETRNQANGGEREKVNLDEYIAKGGALNDVWSDIQFLRGNDPIRTGYPTEKPPKLLERIVEASSSPEMVVADFFGGSGVTAATAFKLGRKFIHVDVNISSIETARDRLISENAPFSKLEIQDGISIFRNPVQTMKLLPSLINGLIADRTLPEYWNGVINDSKYGIMPVHLPNLQEGEKARVVSVATVHKLIYEQLSQLDNVKKVIIYYIDLEDKTLIEEYIHTNNNTGIEIEFEDLKKVLDNIVAQDEVEFEVKEVPDGLLTKWEVDIISFVSDRVKRKIDEFNDKSAYNNTPDSKTICLSENGLEAIEWISVDCTTSDFNAPWNSSQEIRIETDSYISINGTKTRKFWDGKILSDEKPLRLKIRNICGDESTFSLEN